MVKFTVKTDFARIMKRSDDIGFSSEIYFGIYQFGNQFSLKRMSQSTPLASEWKTEGKRLFQSQLSASRNHAKIRSHKKKTFLAQSQRGVSLKDFIPLHL